MDDQTTKTILLDVQLKADQLTQELPALAGSIANLKKQQADLRKEGKEGSMQFQQNAQDLRELSQQYRETNKYIDNVAKARNAENNSIAQNRALLSALTADYVKLGQEQGKMSSSTLAAGKSINDLTKKLKDQEKQIGQTYRNVGNYADSLMGVIPGASRFSSILANMANGFKIFGSSAAEGTGEAAVGLEGMGVASTAALGAIGLIILAVAGLVEYLKDIAPVSNKVGQVWDGMKASFVALANDIRKGDFKNIASDMSEADKAARGLTGGMQDLERQLVASEVATRKEDARISELMLRMKNVKLPIAEIQRMQEEIVKTTENQGKRLSKVAEDGYNLTVNRIKTGADLNKQELRDLAAGGVAYAEQLVKAGKHITDENIKDLVRFENMRTDAALKKTQNEQRSQNLLDRKENKEDGKADKELQQLEKIKEATKQANSERIASLARTLELQQEAFGKELSQTDEHYRQLIFKQEQFISKQEAIIHSKKASPKVKAAAEKAIGASRADIDQLRKEQYQDTEMKLVEHNRKMIDEAARAALELKQIQIASIEDDQKREIAGINNQAAEKIQALKVENAQIQQTTNQLRDEIAAKTAERAKTKDKTQRAVLDNELQALKTTLNAEEFALGVNADKVVEYEKQKEKAIDDTNKKFSDQKQLALDQVAILDAKRTGGKDNPFNSKKEQAEQKALLDEYNAAVTQAGLTEEAKLLIESQYLDRSKELHKSHLKSKTDAEIQAAQLVANTAFSIIENANKRQDQAEQMLLSRSKERELSNSSLTSAQKLAIEEKYRQKEGQAKVQEFKRDQKLNIAKAAIYGALGVLKASPDPFQMALAAAATVAEEAVIISQQPPAYATGGLYQSDGSGALLRGPGTGTSDSINARLSNGEAIINAKSTSMFAPLLSAINEIGGGKSFATPNMTKNFAIGGVFTDGGNANRYYAAPAQNNENLANTLAYQLINNFPPVVVDVKDINTQQSIKAQTINRVNL